MRATLFRQTILCFALVLVMLSFIFLSKAYASENRSGAESISSTEYILLDGPSPTEDLLGTWLFYKYFYQGKVVPAPNPELFMYLTFNADGTDRLFYHRLNENGGCDRTAKYSWDGQQIFQKTIYVSEKNLIDCTKDPDMQPGREATNRMYILNDELYLEMPLSDDIITFIWKRTL